MHRTWLFRIHRWTGLIAGLYLSLVGITGAALAFRQDLQAAAYPQFFLIDDEAPAALMPSTLVRELQSRYPGYRVSGIDWPTYRRGTFLAYVSRGDEFKTVFADPRSGRITGELPFDWIRRLQELHFNLLAGPTGLIVNGAGAAGLLIMCVTGLPTWWRARRTLHATIGVAASLLLVVWALTGMYFAFPRPFRSMVNAMSPLTVFRAPESRPSPRVAGDLQVSGPQVSGPQPDTLIARAQFAVPDARLARVVWPFGERGTFLIVMARDVHGDYDTSDEVSLYFDQYSGELILRRDHRQRSAGDVVTAWIGPLHMGSFGGLTVKIAWAIFGLALPLLFLTGAAMWWSRTPPRSS